MPFLIKSVILKSSIYLLAFFLPYCLFAQTKKEKLAYETTYSKEFEGVKTNDYNKFIFSLSETIPDKNWNNYQGGPINTSDSLFFFGDDLLINSFPTNSNKIKNEYLIFYFSQKTAKCPTLFSLLNYYQSTIKSELKVNDLPEELQLIPVVCSAFNPYSSNGLGGKGFWHLNHAQAIKYGLKISAFLDERRDLKKSTKAATAYLKDLHQKYNDWELTLTAYSSGVVTVNKLLKRHHATTYHEIYPYLPSETKDFVQAFVAMNYIYKYDSYGAVQLNPVINVDTITIDRKLKYEAIEKVIRTKPRNIALLNPVVNQETFPNNYTAYFPKGTKEKFILMKDSIYFYQDSILLKPETKEPEIVIPKDGESYTYTVKSGDVLGVIAQKFNVKVSQLQSWNNLDGTRINIGDKLMIYSKQKKPLDVSEKVETEKEPIQKSGDYTTYTVQSGDNLWIIAKKFNGVSADNIMDFNEIDANLSVGQVLKIPKQ
jgi:membrane-bound lytic murein transglycosylase D